MSIRTAITSVIPCELCARDRDVVVAATVLLPQTDGEHGDSIVTRYAVSCEIHLEGWFDDSETRTFYRIVAEVS